MKSEYVHSANQNRIICINCYGNISNNMLYWSCQCKPSCKFRLCYQCRPITLTFTTICPYHFSELNVRVVANKEICHICNNSMENCFAWGCKSCSFRFCEICKPIFTLKSSPLCPVHKLRLVLISSKLIKFKCRTCKELKSSCITWRCPDWINGCPLNIVCNKCMQTLKLNEKKGK